eukprot:6687690-Alexandrium_andersonii.AAC.1
MQIRRGSRHDTNVSAQDGLQLETEQVGDSTGGKVEGISEVQKFTLGRLAGYSSKSGMPPLFPEEEKRAKR